MRLFVTVGTTKFDSLIENLGQPSFLKLLQSFGITEVVAQTGSSPTTSLNKKLFSEHNIELHHYDYRPSIEDDIKSADLVISHAGAGSILEAVSNHKRLLVVINETLMNNHQLELSEKMSESGYIVYCRADELCEGLQNVMSASLKSWESGITKVFWDHLEKLC